MGMGDEIIASAQARQLYEKHGTPVVIVGRKGEIRTHEVWEHNPKIAGPTNYCSKYPRLVNGPGVRPYIASKTDTNWTWKTWDRVPGELVFAHKEMKRAFQYRGFLMVNPSTKELNGNKAWIWERWVALVRELGGKIVQVGPPGSRVLPEVDFVVTGFREACAILSVCRAFVGTEGAMHHAAAALNIPAVVLWSEYISPEITGYDSQHNIRHATKTCGSRVPCAGCYASMGAIDVEEVLNIVKRVL